MKNIIQLIKIVKPLLPHMILTIILGTLGYLSISAISLFGGMAVLQIGGFETFSSLAILITMIIVAGLLRAIFRLSEQYCTHYIAFRILAIIRDKIFSIARALSPRQLQQFQKGEFMNIVTKDVELLEVFYAHTIAPVCIGILSTIVYVVIFSFLHPLYGVLAFFSYLLIGYAVPKVVYNMGGDAAENYRTQFGALSSFLMDSLKGIKELIIFRHQKETLNVIDQYSGDLNTSTKRLKIHEGILKSLTDTALYFSVFSQIALSVFLYQNGSVNGPIALLAILLLFSSFGPSLALSQLSASLVHTFASAKRVMRVLQVKPEVEVNGTKIINEINTIRFEDVSFGYDESNLLYSNVNAEWRKGEIVAIKGANGTGKSTLIDLLLKNLPVMSGTIKINGECADTFEANTFRKQFSTVDTNTIVFSDTLRRNITMFQDKYDDEAIKIACEKAGFQEFIDSLPNGLDTYMQEYAANISSGQLQRLALARLFLKNSSVFILDEPTSNLDTINERFILQSIKEHAHDKIIIIISHDDNVFAIANKVYKIDNNKIEVA